MAAISAFGSPDAVFAALRAKKAKKPTPKSAPKPPPPLNFQDELKARLAKRQNTPRDSNPTQARTPAKKQQPKSATSPRSQMSNIIAARCQNTPGGDESESDDWSRSSEELPNQI
eukprot:TRINITY_DN6347_c0_g1_i2.p3 TRINITY_DN6347_c0_g1~~TRINITY_DN6347_c0_g1_i2.p3  ORF type:complete len:115 (+),score=24.98 TRINITY_DN6347_c0_g1_i2:562-906(+)